MTDRDPILPLLEALDAAPGGAICEGHVEATGLLLLAEGALETAPALHYTHPNGSRASSGQLVDEIFTGYGRGLIARCGRQWKITDRGRDHLAAHGIAATGRARRLAAEACRLMAGEVFARADARLASHDTGRRAG